MSLLTEELLERFKELGSQEEVEDPIVVCKIFSPSGGATWYITEYLPDDRIFFCYVEGLSPNPWDDEWGYSSLDEMEAVRVPPFSLPLERDLHFEECRFSELDIRKRHSL